MKCKTTPEQKQEIGRLYLSGLSSPQIAKLFGISKAGVLKICEKLGIKRRKITKRITFDENFFEFIDSEYKAYSLGFIFADGYNDEVNGRVSISQTISDGAILTKMAKILKFTGQIYVKDNSGYGGDPVNEICFNSKKMSQDLAKLGCIQRKSLVVRFPDLGNIELMRCFIRGFLDGNGSIYLDGNQGKVDFTSSHAFCSSFKSWIKNNLGVHFYFQDVGKISRLQIGGMMQVLYFLDWVYRDAKIFLERKYQTYLKLKEIGFKHKDWKRVYKAA